ncbi:MAG: hypothetical protein U0232_08290 [Thermomicrobiales bacterium]
MRQIDFIDAKTGWAISGETEASGAVVATDDGGRTWRALPMKFTASLRDRLVSPGVQRGVPNGAIYGASAPSLFPGGVAWLFVSLLDPMQGGESLILRTDDGGASWTRALPEGRRSGIPQLSIPSMGG